MAGLAALCLLLAFSLSGSQSTLGSERETSAHQPPAPHPAPPHVLGLLRTEETAHSHAEQSCRCGSKTCCAVDMSQTTNQDVPRTRRFLLNGISVWEPLTPALFVICLCLTDAQLNKDNDKVGLFIAASVGTFALMAAVYCIYNKFYTKQQYLHTQLNDDSGRWIDPHLSGNGLEPTFPTGNVRWARLRMYKYSHLICHREQSGITTTTTTKKNCHQKKNWRAEGKKRRDKMRLKIKIETLPSQADTKSARLPSGDKWDSPTSLASLISWLSFLLSIKGRLGQHEGAISCSLTAFSWTSPIPDTLLEKQMWNVYVTVISRAKHWGFSRQVGKYDDHEISTTHWLSFFYHRFYHWPHGPSSHLLPHLRWLRCIRCPESGLWLALGHPIHHLCATQPVSPSHCHALPPALPLLSLSENHISQGSGEELDLMLNVDISTVTSRVAKDVAGSKVCVMFFSIQFSFEFTSENASDGNTWSASIPNQKNSFAYTA